MLKPMLIVGVGGSGGKTLRALKVELQRRLKDVGWTEGMPQAWQFLHIDTPVVQEEVGPTVPLLRNEEYLGIVPPGMTYAALLQTMMGKRFDDPQSPAELQRFGNWIPNPKYVKVPIENGAGQYRAIGRTVTVAQMNQVRLRVKDRLDALSSATSRGQLAALGAKLGAGDEVDAPSVIVISSVAGGTGAGAFLDVVEAIKASSNDTWTQRVVAWLYTPDVFAGVNGVQGTPPNSIVALAETMAGLWAKSASEGTLDLYRSRGIMPSNAEDSTVGPRYTFLIGRRNAAVDFDSQTNVYLASAASLAGFMTNGTALEEFWNHYLTNLDTNGGSIADRSDLKVPTIQRPPFMAMGFGRLSMGRDRFRDFAAQRLSRDVIERLLDGHKRDLTAAAIGQKTENDLIQDACNQQWLPFLQSSGLKERNPDNEVVDALTPADREARIAGYRAAFLQKAGVGEKGASPQVWGDRLNKLFAEHRQEFLDEDFVKRNVLVRDWVQRVSVDLPRLVSEYAVQIGLPATARLLAKLDEEVLFCARELEGESAHNLRLVAEVPSALAEALSEGAMAALPTNHPNVQKALRRVGQALDLAAQAATFATARDILLDLEAGVIKPLSDAVVAAEKGLRQSFKDDFLPSREKNPCKQWPDPLQPDVPASFVPPTNERVLLYTSEYVEHYEALLNATVPEGVRGKSSNNAYLVARSVALGRDLEAPDGSASALSYALIDTAMDWVPRAQEHRPSTAHGAAKPARYDIETDALAYAARSDAWMKQAGGAFNDFLDESLQHFLQDPGTDNATLARRQERFMTEFRAVLGASEPLVSINQTVAAAIHPGINVLDVYPSISGIPLEASSELGMAVSNLFDSKLDTSRWFGKNLGAKDISIMKLLANPLQPMVFNSIMDPVNTLWGQVSGDPNARASFYQWRRARPLVEAIPAAPARVQAMIRGWIVADLFDQLRITETDKLGKLVEVWDPTFNWQSFPHPLFHPSSPNNAELLGTVLESLIIAIALSGGDNANPLGPLRAYHRLDALGTDSPQNMLSAWIASGTLPPGAPPSEVTSGSFSSAAARADGLRERLSKKRALWESSFERVNAAGSLEGLTRAWEIHDLRVQAIGQLEAMLVAGLEDEDER